MRHPSPAARAIRNNPAPTATAPVARATRSPAGARRSTVMAAVTTAIARRSVTPMTRRIAVSRSAPAIRTTTQTAIGTALASAGAASRPPSARRPAERRPLRTRSTRRSIPRPPAQSAVPGASRLSCRRPGDSATALAQGWQHHCYHHHDPHAEERRRGAGPRLSARLSGHLHPRQRHRPAAGLRHLAHRRHGRAPDDGHRRAGGEEQRRAAEEGLLGSSLGNHVS